LLNSTKLYLKFSSVFFSENDWLRCDHFCFYLYRLFSFSFRLSFNRFLFFRGRVIFIGLSLEHYLKLYA
jgi:hypothetical protein